MSPPLIFCLYYVRTRSTQPVDDKPSHENLSRLAVGHSLALLLVIPPSQHEPPKVWWCLPLWYFPLIMPGHYPNSQLMSAHPTKTCNISHPSTEAPGVWQVRPSQTWQLIRCAAYVTHPLAKADENILPLLNDRADHDHICGDTRRFGFHREEPSLE